MNPDIERDVLARKWSQDFDEIAERTVPPDRLDSILRRSATAASAMSPRGEESSGRRFWPAALILLSVGATIGVSVLRQAEPAMPAVAPTVVAVQEKAQPETEQEKKKAEQEKADKQKAEQDKKKAERVAAAEVAVRALADEAKAQTNRLNLEIDRLKVVRQLAAQDRQEEIAVKVNALKAEIARLQAELAKADQDKKAAAAKKPAEKKAKTTPEELAQQAANAVRQQVLTNRKNALRQAEVALAAGRVRRGFRGRITSPPKAKNPLIEGDYRAALDRLTRARSTLNTTADPAAARKVIDEMTRILGEARRALWNAEQNAKGTKK